MKAAALWLSVITALAGAACGPSDRDGGGDSGDGDGDGGGDDPVVDGGTTAPRQCNQMDIVFVVDDSASMEEEQTNLATNFPMFAQLLSSYRTPDGDAIDFRVAVTTTGKDTRYSINAGGGIVLPFNEPGDNGKLRNTCGVAKRWLEPSDPNMQQTLACRADVGISGPGFEMPLLMTKWALSDRVADGTNAGFLRPDALLAIVMLTDEDDASTPQNDFQLTVTSQPPVDYHPADLVGLLDALKGHRSRWASTVIAGEGSCSSPFGDAVNAARLKQFVQMANANGTTQATFSSICAGDLTAGLQAALTLFQTACGGVIL